MKNIKKRILIVDYWTRALKNQIVPIYNQLDKSKYEIILVHFASISGHKEKKYEAIEGIPCYDYSNFTKFNVKRIFSKLKPDLIIILNVDGLIDRAVLKYANNIKIPIFYIQHGLSWLHLGEEIIRKLRGNKYTIKRYFKKFNQYFNYLILYLLASLKVDKLYLFKKEFYEILYSAIFNPINFLNYPPISSLHLPTKSFVYGNKDKEVLNKTYGYPIRTIEVAGSILFENYSNFIKDIENYQKITWLLERKLNPESDIVLFLPTVNVEWGIPGCSRDKFEHILEVLSEIIKKNGLNLIIKLHPNADKKLYNILKGKNGIWITRDSDLLDLIWRSDLVIAEPTTALFPAVLLKKKIIILHLMKELNYDFDFCREGVAIDCQTEDDLNRLLNNYNKLDHLINFDNYDIFKKYFCNYSKIKTSKVIAKNIENTLFAYKQ
jgi:hypothetical protein